MASRKADESKQSKETLLIVYGTETGTGQDIAECLWRDAVSRNIETRIMSLADYNIQELNLEYCVVMVIATSGHGEMPMDFRNNWKLMCRKALPDDWLSNVFFAVLGLGDTSYPKYNFAGKKLFRRMCGLSAEPLIDLALADDQHECGVYTVFENFRSVLFKEIFQRNLFPKMKSDIVSTKFPSRFSIRSINDGDQENRNLSEVIASSHDFINVTIVNNQRVTSTDHFQDTRLIEIECWPSMSYMPGDALMVCPCNLEESYNIAVEALGYDEGTLDELFFVQPKIPNIVSHPSEIFEGPTTLRTCLQRYFDLQMVPRKSFFQLLSFISENGMEKERLIEFSSLEGYDDYLDYCFRPKRTVAETLRDFGHTAKRISRERLFDLLEPIRPRAYSIASHPSVHSTLQILVAKVQFETKYMVTPRRGLCSTYLSNVKENDKILAAIRKGTLRLPGPSSSFIGIGTGTGVAALRSFLFCFEKDKKESLLIFGCRGPNKDFYFANDWHILKNTRLITAFSREENKKKQYVQHKIDEYASYIWDLIEKKNGSILIAGRVGDMPKEVLDVLQKIASERNYDGEKFVAELESKGRIQYEVWS